SGGSNGQPHTNRAAAAVAAAPGVEAVSQMGSGEAKVDGKTIFVTGVDKSLTKVVDIRWKTGSNRIPAKLGAGGAFVLDRYATDNSLKVGSPLAMETPTGKTIRV